MPPVERRGAFMSSDNNIDSRIASLTPRERDVFEHLAHGRSNKLTAVELEISPRTVEIHRARVMKKMQAENLSHLVRMALHAGVLPELD
jgi:two-component system response regulator FixJ